MRLLLVLSFVLVASCTKKDKPVEPAAQPVVAETPPNDLEKEWMAIWQEGDKLAALKAFQTKHGLFMETSSGIGELSYLAAEGPCGDTYYSLVKDTKQMSEYIWEINTTGKILQEWQPGDEKIEGFDKKSVYRKMTYFEDPRALGGFTKAAKVNGHDFVIRIGSDGKYELLPEDHKIPGGWDVEEMKCPPTPDINSEYKYCVKEKKSKRLFVLQHPCT